MKNFSPISGAMATDSAKGELVLTADEPKESEYMKAVRAHIKRGQQNLDKLPANQRRALTLETLKHFGCGYLTDWVHPKFCVQGQEKKNKWFLDKKQERIIIPTANHYNAVMLDCERTDENRNRWKQHTSPIELFNEPALLSNADVIVGVEGEIDAMSIWQATGGSVEVVGIIAGNVKLLIKAIQKNSINDKKYLILFDDDKKTDGSNPGQDNAKQAVDALIKLGYPAVSKTFNEFMTNEEIKTCADSKGKIDANQILQRRGDEFLNQLVDKIIDGSRADFEDAAEKVIAEMARKALTPTPAPKNRANRNGRKFQAIDALKAEINSLTAEDLESKGYLVHSEKGAARPNGYCCPVCSSGTHEHKTGALTFYTNSSGNFWKCHACGQSGDVLKLLAIYYGKSAGGKEFFEVLKQAADDFGIKYDADIFKKKTKQERAQERADEINQRRAEALNRLEELRAALDTPENREEIKKLLRQVCEWNKDKYNCPTTIKATVANLDLIFDNDKSLQNFVGYNEFSGEMVLLKDTTWRSGVGTEWDDRDESQLRTYLRRNYCEIKSQETIHDCVIDLSQRNAFHVVKDFFNDLPKWDGVKRAETIFIKFLHADDTPYTREVTMNWLTAAVARIFYPGCDYQLAPILLGNQGIGKSYLLDKLGGKWYGALLDDVSDPHAIDAIQRLWICEIKEMASMRKDTDANKRFIDNAIDTRRAPYARYAVATRRHCVFIITTNNQMCLTDMTGNRRYPVIRCNGKPSEYVDGLTPEFIAQVWSEVYHKFNQKFADVRDIDSVGRLLELSREVKKQVLETADTYTRDDGLTTVIKGFLDTPILPQVIWKLMTREERRKFIVNGKLVMDDALREFNLRRRARGGSQNAIDADIDAIDKALKETSSNTAVKVDRKTIGGRDVDEYHVYGSELRQHICAAEIYEECFGNDRRKTPSRIYEILSQLDGWTLGRRIQKDDPQYHDQKKVYWRTEI